VLDAQRPLLSTELGEAAAARDELVAPVRFYEAPGGGWTEPDQLELAPEDTVMQVLWAATE